jgi:hypothetical protein
MVKILHKVQHTAWRLSISSSSSDAESTVCKSRSWRAGIFVISAFLILMPSMTAVFCARASAAEHLLFRSMIYLDYKDHYRVFLSLHLHETCGVWEAFEVRRVIETTDREHALVYSRDESAEVLAFRELVALGESGFPLLSIPGTTRNVLFLKSLDYQGSHSTLGLSYPIDARPREKKWGWLPLSIVEDAQGFHLVESGGERYDSIRMEVDYRDYFGLKPVGLRACQPMRTMN